MNDLIVSKIDQARLLLAEVRDASDAKKIADMAHAAEVYARRQKLSQDTIDCAHAVKIDAMRMLGEFLKAAPKSGPEHSRGGGSKGSKREPLPTAPPTLAESGIAKKESSQAQKLATIAAQGNGLFDEIRGNRKTIAEADRELQRQQKTADLEAKAKAAQQAIDVAKADGELPWRIINGDCLTWLAQPNMIGRPRLIFADPPHNIGVDYGAGSEADLLDDDEYLRWAAEWIGACRDRLTPDGSLWLLIGDEYAAEHGRALKAAGFTVRAWVKWYETFGVNQANNFNRCSRHLFYCVNDPKRFVFNASAVNRKSDRQTKYGDRRADPAGKVWDDVWQIPRLVGTARERIPEFPTQLPLELLAPIIGCSSEPGDLVLDPFCGSGTTGAAALCQGRRFVGIEKSRRFVELASQRLLAETG